MYVVIPIDDQISLIFSGLVPSTSHKVTIQARKLTGKADDNVKGEHLSATTEFMTAAGGNKYVGFILIVAEFQ